MNDREMLTRLGIIDDVYRDYLSSDRQGSQIADEMYLRLLISYLSGKDSISKSTLKLFTDRISRKQCALPILFVTHQLRIQEELESIERECNQWKRDLGFVTIPFECPELREFPLGISRCIQERENENGSFGTLLDTLVSFVTTEPTNKYTIFKALFFYFASSSHIKYEERLEYICTQKCNKSFFRMLFQETAQYINTTTYLENMKHLRERRDVLLAELDGMAEEKKRAICEIRVGDHCATII